MQTDVFSSSGKKAVAICANGAAGPFSARLYVNCDAGQLGDATLVAKKFQTAARAIKWAAIQVRG